MTMDQCIANCTECHRVCVETLQHCLREGGKHAEADHVRDMIDCAQLCAVCADFMIRKSPIHTHTCGACAEACAACANSCEAVNDSDMMQRCVDACRRCEESCREMANATT